MRSNVVLWYVLAVFFTIVAATYTIWHLVDNPTLPWFHRIEWVGTVALAFSAIMGLMVGIYLGRVHKAQGGELEADRLTADIDDGDPEMGEFSPWSWWPLVLAFSAAVFMVGLAVGQFLLPIGLGIFVIALVGWVYEYYRGYFAR